MSTNASPCQSLIKVTVSDQDPVDPADVCRLIEYLGGVKTEGGYTFPDAARRSVALDLVGERFGNRYVTAITPEDGSL